MTPRSRLADERRFGDIHVVTGRLETPHADHANQRVRDVNGVAAHKLLQRHPLFPNVRPLTFTQLQQQSPDDPSDPSRLKARGDQRITPLNEQVTHRATQHASILSQNHAFIDVGMVVHLSRIYDLPLSRKEAGSLVKVIVMEAAALMGTVWALHFVSSALKVGTAGFSTIVPHKNWREEATIALEKLFAAARPDSVRLWVVSMMLTLSERWLTTQTSSLFGAAIATGSRPTGIV